MVSPVLTHMCATAPAGARVQSVIRVAHDRYAWIMPKRLSSGTWGLLILVAVVASGCGSSKKARTTTTATTSAIAGTTASTGATTTQSTTTRPKPHTTKPPARKPPERPLGQSLGAPGPANASTPKIKIPPEPKAPPRGGKYTYPREAQSNFIGVCLSGGGSKSSCECIIEKFEARRVEEGQSLAELLGFELALKSGLALNARDRLYARECKSALR